MRAAPGQAPTVEYMTSNDPKVIILGVGGAFSSIHHSTTFAVEHDGHWLLVDCPHPIRKILTEVRETHPDLPDVNDFDGIIITHTHADHCSGLEGAAFYTYFNHQRRTPLVCHPEVATRLWDQHLSAGMDPAIHKTKSTFETFFDHVPLSLTEVTQVDIFSIEARKTIHPVMTTALKITVGGRTISYSADTDEDPDLLRWLSEGSDIILHEVGDAIHTPLSSLEGAPGHIRDKVRIVHYPDWLTQDQTSIPVLQGGDLVTLGATDEPRGHGTSQQGNNPTRR